MTNDLRSNAYEVVIPGDDGPVGTYVSDMVNGLAYTTYQGAGDADVEFRHRTAWWRYTPTTAGTVTVSTIGSSKDIYTALRIETGNIDTDGSAVTLVDTEIGNYYDGVNGYYEQITFAATAGETYFISIGVYYDYDAGGIYKLTVDGPATAAPIMVPVADMGLHIHEMSGTGGVTVSAIPAVEMGLHTPDPSRAGRATAAIPAGVVTVRPSPPDSYRVRRVLVSPPHGTILPMSNPTLVVGVAMVEGDSDEITVSVEVRYGTAVTPQPTMITAVVLSLSAETVSFTVPNPLVSGVYYWQARLIIGGAAQDWTPLWSFTVDPTVGAAAVPITLTVTAAPPAPHVWWIDPEEGQTGDEVTIIGQGLPWAQGTVTLNTSSTTPMVVQSWQHVAAKAAATTANRVINTDEISVQHDKIVVLIPDVAPPGGIVVVHGEATT